MTTRALLAGGIGSGKSTAAGFLAALGAHVISADEAGHRVLEPEGAAHAAVAARWPEVVTDGRIDRSALALIVFSEPGLLGELEAMTHPAIRALVAGEVASADAPVVLVEVPLIWDFMGDGWLRVVVDAPDEVRVARLMDKGMARREILGRMAVQPSRVEWIAAADHVIENGSDLAHLEAECRRVWEVLLRFKGPGASRGAPARPR